MRARSTLAALAALVALAGGSGFALPTRCIIERVPFVKQEPRWCGPAALASVLRYYGLDVTQRAIAAEIALPGGVLNLDLKLYARARGFRAESLHGDLERLKSWVARGVPVICQVRRGGSGKRGNHFVVVFGYDDRDLCLIAHTGERAAHRIPYLDFARTWRDGGNWMLVVRPGEGETAAAPGAGAAPQPETGSTQ